MSQDQLNEAMENLGMSPVTKVAMPLEVEVARIKEGLRRLEEPLSEEGIRRGNYTALKLLRIARQVMEFLEANLEEAQKSEGSPPGSPSCAHDESARG